MLFIGIDNGLSGGIVTLDVDGRVVSKQLVPTQKVMRGKTTRMSFDLQAIRELAIGWGRQHARWAAGDAAGTRILVGLERGQPMPPALRGGNADFSGGYCYGMWLAFLTAFKLPHMPVVARLWQHRFLSGTEGTDSKQRSILRAKQIHPNVDWRASARSKKPHSGLTDAFWLAEFVRRYGLNKDA